METLRIVLLVIGLVAFFVGVPIMFIVSMRGGMSDARSSPTGAAFNALAELDKVIRPSVEHRVEAETKIQEDDEKDGE